jgi:hypothetical protein
VVATRAAPSTFVGPDAQTFALESAPSAAAPSCSSSHVRIHSKYDPVAQAGGSLRRPTTPKARLNSAFVT